MFNQKLEQMLNEAKNQIKPGKWFALKMKIKIYKKKLAMLLHRPFGYKKSDSSRRFKLATVLALLVLTFGSGIGAYAYASPEVTVLSPLYPVKQSLESAESYFAQTPSQKAAFNRKKALRRMAEAEVLSHRLKQPVDSNYAEEGVRKTLEEMEKSMQESVTTLAEEEEPVTVSKAIDETANDFDELDEKLNLMGARERLKQIKSRLIQAHDFAKKKMEVVKAASEDVSKAIKEKHPKVFLKKLVKSKEMEQKKEKQRQSKETAED